MTGVLEFSLGVLTGFALAPFITIGILRLMKRRR